MILSPSQSQALDKLNAFLTSPAQRFILTGAAGTGKTTILKEFLSQVTCRVDLLAPTGKAALRMTEVTGRPATTIHYAIYQIIKDGRNPEFEYNDRTYDGLAIVDEASMLSPEMVQDLESAYSKILYVGDPYQLPPVNDIDWLNSQPADAALTEVHRQALESPILALATNIRNGLPMPPKCEGEELQIQRLMPPPKDWQKFDQILCHTNVQRSQVNGAYRKLLKHKQEFERGERLVNLFNRYINKDFYVPNGQLMTVVDFSTIGTVLEVNGETFIAPISRSKDTLYNRASLWVDYSYALTVHKAQGSQWDSVCVLNCTGIRDPKERRRWMYTAVTRAAKHLTLVG